MKIFKSGIGIMVALGLCSLTTTASAQVVFNPRFPVVEVHAAGGGAGSFAAASVMGARGFSNVPTPANFETFITSGCNAKTKTLAAPPIGTGTLPLSVWPGVCNPDGMALFLNEFSPVTVPRVNWITVKTTNQALAISELIRGLRDFGSPGIIPIYGQADHWVAVTQVTVSSTGALLNVRAFDGGKIGGIDSGFNSYFAGLQSWGATAFRNTFFLVVSGINPLCDNTPNGGCGAAPNFDPFANKFVLMFEPPGAAASVVSEPVVFATLPGITSKGSMNETVAQLRAQDALISAGIAADAQMWGGIKGGTFGTAHRVSGVWPSGAAWEYYLVPVLSKKNSNLAVGFVQLDAADGSFQGVNLLDAPAPFAPINATRARDLAEAALNFGDGITGGGTLTWDPRSSSPLAKSPSAPYYEFEVTGLNGTAVVRVRLNDGVVVRTDD